MRKKYNSLNFFRALGAIGIVLMHVQANMPSRPTGGFVLDTFIPSCTHFVLLFFILSGFSMSCGYYQKFREGTININRFYKRRYLRILPFFAILVFIDLIMSPSLHAFYEGFADISLTFGLLPNPQISVIGVGWFLGTIFLFYMLFPFFVYLLWNKKRAWVVLLLSIIYHLISVDYFLTEQFNLHVVGRHNIIYSFPFICTGGIIFLYSQAIERFVCRHRWLVLFTAIVVTAVFYVLIYQKYSILSVLPILLVFSIWCCYAIGVNSRLFNNKVTAFLSNISMELYLCHMLFFRLAIATGIWHSMPNKTLAFVFTTLLTLAGAICFSWLLKYLVFPRISYLNSKCS